MGMGSRWVRKSTQVCPEGGPERARKGDSEGNPDGVTESVPKGPSKGSERPRGAALRDF